MISKRKSAELLSKTIVKRKNPLGLQAQGVLDPRQTNKAINGETVIMLYSTILFYSTVLETQFIESLSGEAWFEIFQRLADARRMLEQSPARVVRPRFGFVFSFQSAESA